MKKTKKEVFRVFPGIIDEIIEAVARRMGINKYGSQNFKTVAILS